MRNENNCVSVYVPDSLENNNVGFLPGFIQREGSNVKFYITDDRLRDVRTGCIGYCGLAAMESSEERPTYWIRVSFSDGKFQVSHILCDGVQEYKLLYIFYDFKSFKKSNVMLASRQSKDDFFYLSRSLANEYCAKKTPNYIRHNMLYRFFNWFLMCTSLACEVSKKKFRPLAYSSTFLHLESNIGQARSILETIAQERRLTLQVQNVLVSKLLDVTIGIFILHWLLQYQSNVGEMASEYAANVITHIGKLLKFLMGSPVGLKLNNAFNKALGHFFIYNISLWNTFLAANSPLLSIVARLTCCLAAFGFTYQIALAADVFAIATFHVYCIYVYAARLYGVQVRGLVALWRLFLGRKRNPLKDRVDTYHYNSHQLFVGTLAFSVLLFLLPTTALYYLVFITLRLILLAVFEILESLRRFITDFPVYLTCLWLMNSPRIKGDVHVAVRPTSGALTVHATVKAGSWKNCCRSKTRSPGRTNRCPESPPKNSLLATIAFGHLI